MSHDRYQHDEFDGCEESGETVSFDTAPSGVSLDIFWALVDPIDPADPRDS